ncbi:Crp/Fnr family transcriptional regulator [Mucilaginibacter antarcticus]|uniref:Crp/Fnr family transcriptional regulator n=1 Tax=Mucilaginibacter antarcticus TaxID=1855725 RepID=A0ABW5XUT7_9SPHI
MHEHEKFKNFEDYLYNQYMLGPETIQLIRDRSKIITVPKNSFLLSQGRVCKYVYFIQSGQAISYLTDSAGRSNTWFFHFNGGNNHIENVFAVDYKSFLVSDPSSISIKTLTEVTAVQLSKEDLNLMLKVSYAFENWIRILNEKIFILVFNRTRSLLTMSASERYIQMLHNEPYLFNMFSSYYIATYLGIAPQSLSRIRKSAIRSA